MYKNNPDFELAFEVDNYRIYKAVDITKEIHTIRYIEAVNQEIYNRAGATKEVLEQAMNEIITRCNEVNFKTARTDIAAIANSVVYRLKYPVDEHCALRMGHILTFMEFDKDGETISEDNKATTIFWMNRKFELSMNNPDVYAFFLTMGMVHSQTYNAHLNTLTDSTYFQDRQQKIAALLPFNSKLTETT